MKRFKVVPGTGASFCGIYDSVSKLYTGMSSKTDTKKSVRADAALGVKLFNSNPAATKSFLGKVCWITPGQWFSKRHYNGKPQNVA